MPRICVLILLIAFLPLTDAQVGSKPSPASCCSNVDGKPLRQLNLAETLEWLQCNQIAADAIEIVKREKVVGYEMSLMSQDELMELLGMTKIHSWRVSRCKDVTDGTRRWGPGGAGDPKKEAAAPSQQAAAPPPPPPSRTQQRGGGRGTCRFGEDLTGKRCFGYARAPDPAWTPASCKDQCCRRAGECGTWLYSYAEGCWFGQPDKEYNCRDEAGWFGGKSML
mmetsp:Transcript_8795/g.17581  ORF Transcript_8795/g.17581 Transcript_8795/m.17581 type:complete len:223 (+) Transcript_8795:30-698(+)